VNDDDSATQIATPQQRVVETASAILRGELGVIQGARLLCSLQARVSSVHHDPDFLPFIVIDTETDHLPVGDVRQHWAPDALARKDIEIHATEDFYRATAFTGCQRLIDRFSSTSNDQTRDT
jgi:hypothetical protein